MTLGHGLLFVGCFLLAVWVGLNLIGEGKR